ncbi:MAG TPA: hypothetical protein VD864_05235 [Nocardioides sp.]|nr:hypothetical protein [Nocardioides sp.]
MTGLEWLTYDRFAAHLGEAFDVGVEGGSATVPMVLAEATESDEPGGPGPAGQQRMQFSLVFRGPLTPLLPQGTYRLHHAEMGDLDLFLVPLGPIGSDGPDGGAMRYEAAFA